MWWILDVHSDKILLFKDVGSLENGQDQRGMSCWQRRGELRLRAPGPQVSRRRKYEHCTSTPTLQMPTIHWHDGGFVRREVFHNHIVGGIWKLTRKLMLSNPFPTRTSSYCERWRSLNHVATLRGSSEPDNMRYRVLCHHNRRARCHHALRNQFPTNREKFQFIASNPSTLTRSVHGHWLNSLRRHGG